MTNQLNVRFFDTTITDNEVKQLLLRSQPGDFYWGAPYRPPYLIDYATDGDNGTWAITGKLPWEEAREARTARITSRAVEVLLAYPGEPVGGVVHQEHLREALMSLPLGAVFQFSNSWYRIVKREILVSSGERAELSVFVEVA